jgi:hypothetical protein
MLMRNYFLGLFFFLWAGTKTIFYDNDEGFSVVAVEPIMCELGIIGKLNDDSTPELTDLTTFCSKDAKYGSIARLLPQGLVPTRYQLLSLAREIVPEVFKEQVIAKWIENPTTGGLAKLAGSLPDNLNEKLNRLYQVASCIDLWKVASEASKNQIGTWIKNLIASDKYLAGMLAVMYPDDISKLIGNDQLDMRLEENHDLIESLNPLLDKGDYSPNLINFLLFAGVKPSSWTKLAGGYRFIGMSKDEFDNLCKNYVGNCLGIREANVPDLEKINGELAPENRGIVEGIFHAIKEFFWNAPTYALGYAKWCFAHNTFPYSVFNNILRSILPFFLVSLVLISYPITFCFANILCIVAISWCCAVNFWENRYKYGDPNLLVKEVWPNDT